MNAEREMQRSFRKILLLQQFILTLLIVGFHGGTANLPNRVELGSRIARIHFAPVEFDSSAFAPLRLAGAWELSSNDPRVGGVSALAMDGTALLALTDSGVLIRFSKPVHGDSLAIVRELPDGPADGRFKSQRDSEALVRDPAGRSWWVAFENRNELWCYDTAIARGLGRYAFGTNRWPLNRGIEGLSVDRSGLLLFPEQGGSVIRLRGNVAQEFPLEGARGRISDAARLPDGRLVVINRNLTILGFSNRLTLVQSDGRNYRLGPSIRIAVSPLDNVEAIASERLADGTIRLWLMTDDNFQRPMRTLLLALDWPLKPRAAPRPSSKSRA